MHITFVVKAPTFFITKTICEIRSQNSYIRTYTYIHIHTHTPSTTHNQTSNISMPSYSITEPHPTVAASTWCHAGRGGAGNFFKAPKAVTSPSGVPTPITPTVSHSTTATSKFHSGRGGAGNAHSSIERAAISFEDEFERKERSESVARPAFTGRGGAGNFKSATSSPFGSKGTRKGSDASTASNASTKSGGSTRSGFLGRLSASLSHTQ